MNHSTLSTHSRHTPLWTKLAAASLLSIAIAGCGGGSNGAAGPAGATGAAGAAGAAGKDLTALVNVTSLTTDQWKALKPKIDPASISVAINSPPVVTFKVTDDKGLPLVGLGGQSKSATALVPSNFNIAFTLAKLVPGSNNEPSKWVSYLITKPGTVAAPTTVGTYPTSDSQGTLVDNGDGSYKYTFYRDIKAAKAFVDGLVDDATAGKLKADLGDVTYDATLTHRLGIIISGSQPGTGTATPTAVQTVAPAPLLNTFNIGYDFVPAGGAVTVTRDIVAKDSCGSCHDGRAIGHISSSSATNGIPGGKLVGRNDPRLCVTCHTDQTKYGFLEVTKTATGYSGNYGRVNGEAAFTFPRMVHQFHMGKELTKTGYNLNNHCNLTTGANTAACFNTVGLPQSPANCTTCHDASNNATSGTIKTANGDNWKNVPSILACGACHDGINFADGTGTTVSGATTGHLGGAKANNAQCVLCHDAVTIPVYHRTTNATPNNLITQDGVVNFSYSITSVTLNTSKQPVIKFQIKKDGVAVTSLATPSLVTNAVTGAQVVSPAFEPIPGFAGGPSLYVAYAVPEDGIVAPADFNAYQSVSLTNLLVASGSPKAGTLTADSAGNFTATLTGDLTGQPATVTCKAITGTSAIGNCVNPSPIVVPTSAVMVTGAIMGSFTQKGLAAYPYVAADVSVSPNKAASGGLLRPTLLKKLVATGYTARRVIVEAARCNTCHDQLGTEPAFHSGAYNDPTACNVCHNNTRTSSGWAANSNNHVHAIHGASKRSVPFTWHGTAASDYSKLGYPGVLSNCSGCHLPNTVNYGATGTALAPSLLWPSVATGKFTAPAAGAVSTLSPYIVADGVKNYGNGFSFVPAGAVVSAQTKSDGTVVAAHIAAVGGEFVAADANTLVSSPISTACFSCHDTGVAKAHMVTNGGAIYEARATALTKTESCLACHGAGKEFDAAAVHQ